MIFRGHKKLFALLVPVCCGASVFVFNAGRKNSFLARRTPQRSALLFSLAAGLLDAGNRIVIKI